MYGAGTPYGFEASTDLNRSYRIDSGGAVGRSEAVEYGSTICEVLSLTVNTTAVDVSSACAVLCVLSIDCHDLSSRSVRVRTEPYGKESFRAGGAGPVQTGGSGFTCDHLITVKR